MIQDRARPGSVRVRYKVKPLIRTSEVDGLLTVVLGTPVEGSSLESIITRRRWVSGYVELFTPLKTLGYAYSRSMVYVAVSRVASCYVFRSVSHWSTIAGGVPREFLNDFATPRIISCRTFRREIGKLNDFAAVTFLYTVELLDMWGRGVITLVGA